MLFLIVTYCLPVTPPQLTVNGPLEPPGVTSAPQGTAVELDVSPAEVPAKTRNGPFTFSAPPYVLSTTSEIGVFAGTSTVIHGEFSLSVTATELSSSASIALEARYGRSNVELWEADTGVTRGPTVDGGGDGGLGMGGGPGSVCGGGEGEGGGGEGGDGSDAPTV